MAIRAERGVLQLFGYELVCSRTGEYGAPQETTSEYNCGTLDESWCEEFEDVVRDILQKIHEKSSFKGRPPSQSMLRREMKEKKRAKGAS